MKANTVLVFAIAALAASGFSADIPWAKDFKSASATAKAGGKLVMIDFFTEW